MRILLLGLILNISCALYPMPAAAQSAGAGTEPIRVYIGTYTLGNSKGIYQMRLNTRTGALENLGLACAVENPSFLALHPNKPVLYAVGEMAAGGVVSAFSIEAGTGSLCLLNQQSSEGKGPCHVAVSRAGQHVLCANYGGGSVAVLPIDAEGRLREATALIQHQGSSVHPQRQQGPHAHSVTLDKAGRFVFAADLGLDKIMIYRMDEAQGTLPPNDPAFTALKPGAGPRHFAFHPGGRFAYVVNELDNTVTAFSYDAASGKLETLHSAGTLPNDFKGENSTAEIRVHPSGRYVYCSNRGHDSIAIFGIDSASGRLTPLGHTYTRGHVPRNFNIDPSGKYLLAANQKSGTVAVFHINLDTGLLEPLGKPVEVPTPVCVLFVTPPPNR